MTPACMGGWCKSRNGCAVHLQDDRRIVVERLCPRGVERPVNPYPQMERIERVTRLMEEVRTS